MQANHGRGPAARNAAAAGDAGGGGGAAAAAAAAMANNHNNNNNSQQAAHRADRVYRGTASAAALASVTTASGMMRMQMPVDALLRDRANIGDKLAVVVPCEFMRRNARGWRDLRVVEDSGTVNPVAATLLLAMSAVERANERDHRAHINAVGRANQAGAAAVADLMGAVRDLEAGDAFGDGAHDDDGNDEARRRMLDAHNNVNAAAAQPQQYTPAVRVVEETLESEDGQYLGYRVGIFVVKPTVDLGAELEAILRENRKRYIGGVDEEQQGGGGGAGGSAHASFGPDQPQQQHHHQNQQNGGARGKQKSAAASSKQQPQTAEQMLEAVMRRVTSKSELAVDVFGPYLSHRSEFGAIEDVLESDDDPQSLLSVSRRDSPLSVYKVLDWDRSMTLPWSNRVCVEQRSPDTYVNNNDGAGGVFMGFPARSYAVAIDPAYCSALGVLRMPLPRMLQQEIVGPRRDIMAIETEIKTVQEQANRNGTAGEKRVTSRIEAMRMKVALLEAKIATSLRRAVDPEAEKAAQAESPNPIDKLREFNELFDLAESNSRQVAAITHAYEQVHRDPAQFAEDFRVFREKALLELERVISTSTRVSPGVKAGRSWFAALDKRRHWVLRPQSAHNLSVYGNMRINMMCELDKFKMVDTNFRLALVGILVAVDAGYCDNALQPNLHISGPPGAGKSFVFDLMEELAPSGMVQPMTQVTAQAQSGEGDHSDVCIINHEALNSYLGKDNNGNAVGGNPFIKNMLTKPVFTTMAYGYNAETRKREMSVFISRVNITRAMASNENDDTRTATMSRFLNMHMYQRARGDDDPHASVLGTTPAHYTPSGVDPLKSGSDELSLQFQLRHWYAFLVMKAIEAKAMPGVDVDVAKHVASHVLRYARDNGIPPPSNRVIGMYLSLCRCMTLLYAVHAEFFSELGTKHRVDAATGAPREFSLHEDLPSLTPWLVCTQEIAIDVFTMLQDCWVPTLKMKVVDAFVQKSTWPVNVNDLRSVNFRKLYTEETVTRANSITGRMESAKMRTPEHDARYLQITGANFLQIAAQLADMMGKEKPAVNDVRMVMTEMCEDFISCPEWVVADDMEPDLRADPTGQTMVPVKRYRAARSAEDVARYGGPSRVPCMIMDADPDKPGGKRLSLCVGLIDKPYDKVFYEALHAFQHRFTTPGTYITCLPITHTYDDERELTEAERRDEDNEDAATEERMAAEGNDRDTIVEAIAIARQQRRAVQRTETLYQLCRTLDIKPNPEKVLNMENSRAQSKAEKMCLFAEDWVRETRAAGDDEANPLVSVNSAMMSRANIHEMADTLAAPLDQDLDEYHINRFASQNGLGPEADVVLPRNTRNAVWYIRKHNPVYATLNQACLIKHRTSVSGTVVRDKQTGEPVRRFMQYPDDWLRYMIEHRQRKLEQRRNPESCEERASAMLTLPNGTMRLMRQFDNDETLASVYHDRMMVVDGAAAVVPVTRAKQRMANNAVSRRGMDRPVGVDDRVSSASSSPFSTPAPSPQLTRRGHSSSDSPRIGSTSGEDRLGNCQRLLNAAVNPSAATTAALRQAASRGIQHSDDAMHQQQQQQQRKRSTAAGAAQPPTKRSSLLSRLRPSN